MKKRFGLVTLGLIAILSPMSLMAQNPQASGHKEFHKPVGNDTVACSQNQRQHYRKICDLPNLTSVQKEKVNSVKSNFAKESLVLKNKSNELSARIRTLISEGNEVTVELKNAISELSSNREKLEMLKANEVMSIKALLTPEQKVTYNQRLAKMGNKSRFMNRDGRMKSGRWQHDKDAVRDSIKK